MKVGILSDIHGNHYALAEVLREATAFKVEHLMLCGDYVDYYYRPDLVLDLIQQWSHDAVRGNHEEYLFKALHDPDIIPLYVSKYGHGLKEAILRLTPPQIEYLKLLPLTRKVIVDGISFLLCHGSPRSVDEYLYPDSDPEMFKKCLDDLSEGTVVLHGHSHYQYTLQQDRITVLNPGSVGQNRQRGGFAHWAIFDTVNRAITFHQTPYPIDELVDDVRRLDANHPYLEQVLRRRICPAT